jgi:hypothetical protein
MIKQHDLKQIENFKKEIKYIEDKIKKIEAKPVQIVQDSVSASSASFPYTRHTARIEGFENPKNLRKYKKLLKNRRYDLEKAINQLEYKLNKIDDSELRMLIRYKYEDNLNYVQIAHRMNDLGDKIYTEDSVRMKIKRFFEKSL